MKFYKKTVLKLIMVLMLAGSFISCEKSEETNIAFENITGTVIGDYYYGGIGSLLVGVDKKYPIGKTIEYGLYCGVQLLNDKTYRNVIQVQPRLPLSNPPDMKTLIGRKMSFSYREYQRGTEGSNDGDYHLFLLVETPSNGMCMPPDVPTYVITDCQILK